MALANRAGRIRCIEGVDRYDVIEKPEDFLRQDSCPALSHAARWVFFVVFGALDPALRIAERPIKGHLRLAKEPLCDEAVISARILRAVV